MWLSIHLPQLPLESLHHDATRLPTEPVGVIEQQQIICLNPAAVNRGVKAGLSLASAYALCDGILLYERNPEQELQMLRQLALLAYQFSPNVVIGDNGLVLEIARSLKLYRGLEPLIEALSRELEQEAVSFQLAIGHSASAAEIMASQPLASSLACWLPSAQQLDKNKLEQQLAQLPVDLLPLAGKSVDKILSVGIKNLGQLMLLPVPALRKRFGQATCELLLKIFNRLPDPRDYFEPPEHFYEHQEFLDVVHHRQGLLFPIKRLVNKLCRFLTIKQKQCQSLHWQLFDSEKNLIGFEVLITDSQIKPATYLELTQLNLERYTLHAPIQAISLSAERLTDLAAANEQLFETSGSFKQSNEFINKIRAKLGKDSCYNLQQQDQHVPELAFQQITGLAVGSNSTPTFETTASMPQVTEPQADYAAEYQTGQPISCANDSVSRPSWLFEKPQAIRYSQTRLLWHGELKIISAQERITHYWWEKKVARDYYLAEHDDGTIYWVFFDQVQKQWFLHGVYG